MSTYAKKIAKAMTVFSKARLDLNKTMTAISRSIVERQDTIHKLESEVTDLEMEAGVAATLHAKLTAFIGDGPQDDAD